MNEAEFQRNLTRFKAVLKREKRYLIKNDGEKVTETVSQKEKFIPIFENYDGPVSDKTKAMIDEIQELQSVNLMLTKQPSGTYSKYKQMPKESSVSLVDQQA